MSSFIWTLGFYQAMVHTTVRPRKDRKGLPARAPFGGNPCLQSDWTSLILNQELHINNSHLSIKACDLLTKSSRYRGPPAISLGIRCETQRSIPILQVPCHFLQWLSKNIFRRRRFEFRLRKLSRFKDQMGDLSWVRSYFCKTSDRVHCHLIR
jgi:hypothetical protein